MLEQYMVNSYEFDTIQQINDNLVYLDYIDANYDFETITIPPDVAYKYQGNFFGLLRTVANLPPQLYLYTLYINGLTNPVDYTGEAPYFIKVAIRPPIPLG